MEDATLPSMGRGGSGPKASSEVKNAHWPPKKNDPVHSHEPPENCCCCPQKVVEEDPRMVRVKSSNRSAAGRRLKLALQERDFAGS